jgi:hypothetical protein
MPIVQTFVFLQLVDLLTTIMGLKWGSQEFNPFIRSLMQVGLLEGLLACKLLVLVLAGVMIWYERVRVLLVVNYIFAALVIWNLVQLLMIPRSPMAY